jgi:hypothetical protein
MNNQKSQIAATTGLCFILLCMNRIFERIDAKFFDNQSLALNIVSVLIGVVIVTLFVKRISTNG